jgi:hypothetical protein
MVGLELEGSHEEYMDSPCSGIVMVWVYVDLEVMNQACIIKLGWKLVSGANEWWCEVMRGKYDCRALTGETNVQGITSNLWKYIFLTKECKSIT